MSSDPEDDVPDLRDLFAMTALTTVLHSFILNERFTGETVAKYSYMTADAMMAERKKRAPSVAPPPPKDW